MKSGHPTPGAPASRPTGLPAGTPAAGGGTARLGWLDALRGIAALIVAVHHGCYHYLPQFRHEILRWFDPGEAGVLVFFLVSGYIIPASLERTGSLRRFWISRLFRIYPLLLVVLGGTLLLALTGLTPLRQGLGTSFDPVAAVLAHLTMMQDLFAVPSALNVLWTLSYEMAFYLLVVALFAAGRLNRHSSVITTVLALAALSLAVVLPTAALSDRFGVTRVAVAGFVIMVVAIGAACSGRPAVSRAGALLGGGLAAALVLLNGRVQPWEGLVLLGVMFAGTAIHRAEQGQIRVRGAAVAAGAVLAAAVVAGLWHITVWAPGQSPEILKRSWVITFVVTALVFAAGMALRHRKVPRRLARLGVISYSVYLVHPLLLAVLDVIIGRPGSDRPLLLVPYLILVLLVSEITYRIVEAPLQRYGRRLARRTAPAPPPVDAGMESVEGVGSVEPGSPSRNRAVPAAP
ncbi:acyltransferase family protein [Actinomadura sp. 9N407]|uniref:acyltransferase family protein n=1 Tax=Actinomadura sp. 9N407 TaxID=3375154 RepID=UPI0037A38F30